MKQKKTGGYMWNNFFKNKMLKISEGNYPYPFVKCGNGWAALLYLDHFQKTESSTVPRALIIFTLMVEISLCFPLYLQIIHCALHWLLSYLDPALIEHNSATKILLKGSSLSRESKVIAWCARSFMILPPLSILILYPMIYLHNYCSLFQLNYLLFTVKYTYFINSVLLLLLSFYFCLSVCKNHNRIL